MEMMLQRDVNQPAPTQCTYGVLSLLGRTFPTIERPWVDLDGFPGGDPQKSCVTAGRYRLERHNSEAHPNSLALVNATLNVYHLPADIPREKRAYARSAILIHPANYAHELLGCIAPGKSRGKDPRTGEFSVWESRSACNEIRQLLANAIDLWLTITDGRFANDLAA